MLKKGKLEKGLKECTSKENWNAPPAKKKIIASQSFHTPQLPIIFKHIWSSLDSKGKQATKIVKVKL